MPQKQEHVGLHTERFSGLALDRPTQDVDAEFSTIFQNCEISPEGAVVRRGGTLLINSTSKSSYTEDDLNVYSRAITLSTGTTYLVTVSNDGITINRVLYQTDKKVALGTPMNKTQVWSKPLDQVNFVHIKAPYDRLLILTGNHPPVQLSFLERDIDFQASTSGSLLTLTRPFEANDFYGWKDLNIAATRIWRGEVEYTILSKTDAFSVSISSTGFTVTPTMKFSYASITWQWWADTEYYRGLHFNQSTTRAHVSIADQQIETPLELKTNFPTILANDTYIGLTASSVSSVCAGNIYTLNAAPSTNDQYKFMAGGRYVYDANHTPPSNPDFLTFAGIKSGNNPEQCHIFRQRLVRLRNGAGVLTSDLGVFVDGVQVSKSLTECTTNDYSAYITGYTANIATQTTTYAALSGGNPVLRTVGFTGGRKRIPYESIVRLVDQGGVAYLGNAARRFWLLDRNSGQPNHDGKYICAYGLGRIFDYISNEFPLIAAFHEERLILRSSRFPTLMVASAVADSIVAGEYYSFFQIDENLEGVATDPFDIQFETAQNTGITAAVSWQGRLLVFTDREVFGVSGEPFTVNTTTVSSLTSKGVPNHNCVVVSELSVLFLNSTGVYDLFNRNAAEQISVIERSEKVRPLFTSSLVQGTNPKNCWLFYDELNNKLWVGLSTNGSRYSNIHLVYDTLINSWSTFTSVVNLLMKPPTKFKTTIALLVRGEQYYNHHWLVPYQDFYMDFATYQTSATFSTTTIASPGFQFSTTVDKSGVYNTNRSFGLNLRDADGLLAVKHDTKWVTLSASPSSFPLFARQYLGDLTQSKFLVSGVTPPTSWLPVVVAQSGCNLNIYPNAGAVSGSPTPPQNYLASLLTGPGFGGVPQGETVGFGSLLRISGVCYQSIVASAYFHGGGLANIKRMKQLIMRFDPTVADKTPYQDLPNVRLVNLCHVGVEVSSGISGERVSVTEQPNIKNYSQQPGLEAVFSYALSRLSQLEVRITLAGLTNTYRWVVTSIGAEAFKLTSYQFDATVAKETRFRRD